MGQEPDPDQSAEEYLASVSCFICSTGRRKSDVFMAQPLELHNSVKWRGQQSGLPAVAQSFEMIASNMHMPRTC